MDGQLIGLVAVVMSLGIPLGAMYTYYRVRKLRSEERLAAIARGASVPMVAELSETARSRRSGILPGRPSGTLLGVAAGVERRDGAFGHIPTCDEAPHKQEPQTRAAK